MAKLAALSGEFLFFFGAGYLALMLAWRRRFGGAALMGTVAVLWLLYHLPVSLYLESLGSDSFQETRGFDLNEARFWWATLDEAIQPMFSLKKLLGYSLAVLASFLLMRLAMQRWAGWSARTCAKVFVVLAVGLMAASVQRTTSAALAYYLENSRLYDTTVQHFTQPVPAVSQAGRDLSLVVYIGESTSAMNMGLYGYPRDTTPELQALARSDAGLLVFHNVYATHAHTSRSLLEALSVGLDAREAFLPIASRKRVPIVDVLQRAGVESRLASNQGMGGSWDHASSIIFRNAAERSFRVRPAPDAPPSSARFDDEFFDAPLRAWADTPGARALFLHSYGGHGPYLENIPERFRGHVDAKLEGLAPQALSSDPAAQAEAIEAYDSATRYVDFSLTQAIRQVAARRQPTVLVYFSDHGDAVYAGRGHDSARFKHEMARVPYLMYFNEAARRQPGGLFDKYRTLADARHVATLAQLPSTLLDLLAIGAPANPGILTAVVGERTPLPPILVRDAGGSFSYLNLNPVPLPEVSPLGHRVVDRTDEDTRLHIALNAGRASRREACAGRPPTFEAMSRRILVAGCKEPATTDDRARL